MRVHLIPRSIFAAAGERERSPLDVASVCVRKTSNQPEEESRPHDNNQDGKTSSCRAPKLEIAVKPILKDKDRPDRPAENEHHQRIDAMLKHVRPKLEANEQLQKTQNIHRCVKKLLERAIEQVILRVRQVRTAHG